MAIGNPFSAALMSFLEDKHVSRHPCDSREDVRRLSSSYIWGLYGSGKTSILRKLLTHASDDTPILYSDVDGASPAELLAQILRMGRSMLGATRTEQIDSAQVLSDILNDQRSRGTTCVFLLDNAQDALKMTSEGTGVERSLAKLAGDAIFILTGTLTPDDLKALNPPLSPFLRKVSSWPLGALTKEDARDLLLRYGKTGAPWVEEQAEGLISLAGPLPRPLLIAAEWFQELYSAGVPVPEISSRALSVLRANPALEDIFEQYLDTLSSNVRSALEALANGKTATGTFELERLRQYGLVVYDTKLAESGAPYSVASQLFLQYVRAQSGPQIALTDLDKALLELFRAYVNSGKYLTEEILASAWEGPVGWRTIQMAVSRLNRKLQSLGVGRIESRRGQGYYFVPAT